MRLIVGGVTGRTGLEVARRLVLREDVDITAGVGARSAGRDLGEVLGPSARGRKIYPTVEEAHRAGEADVYLDFTHAAAAEDHALRAVPLGLRPLVGTSGLAEDVLQRLAEAVGRFHLSGAVIPNFSLGALRLKRMALDLADDYDQIEILEYHGRHKRDKPSGTALDLQRALAARGRDSEIHSVRLDGMVAHQAVLFGADGEVVTLRHDVTSRSAYAQGVVAAASALLEKEGFFRSLESLLEGTPFLA